MKFFSSKAVNLRQEVCKKPLKSEKLQIRIIIVWVLAVVLLADSVARSFRSNFNFGLLLMYLLTAAHWAYALFHRPIDAFCADGIGRWLKILFFCGVGLFCLLLGFVAVSGYAGSATGAEKAVVVLGAGLRKDVPSDLLRRRLDAAYAYYQDNPEVVIVVTGGQGSGETIPEGVAMGRYLAEKGVPQEQIIVEQKSTSTEENLLFAKELLEQRGIGADEPMAVVTNAFHCYRARCYARLVGFEQVSSIPASIGLNSVMPCYMREVFAVLYYWVFKSSQSGWISPLVGIL